MTGLRSSGPGAPLVLDGPMTSEAFRADVEQFLAPAIFPSAWSSRKFTTHKMGRVAEAIAAAGASIFYLPPFRPDLNLSSRCPPS